ncbi:MAG: geranylgeranyl reductase family protein [Bacteroidia bacterium]|nr:geranylgeranyl reductase family protein [Bacteroidia bacterium]
MLDTDPVSPSIQETDVLIAGAGPAGTTCALALAESGLRVTLVDKAAFPRDKICGDALSGKVVSVLKYLNLAVRDDLYAFPEKLGSWGIRFIAPSGEALDIPFASQASQAIPRPPGFISPRLDFDNFLLEQVRQRTDTRIIEGFPVMSLTRTPTGILATGPDGAQIRTRLLIGADGAHSVVTRQLSDIRMDKRHHSAGIRVYYQGITGFHERNFIELHYIRELLPGYLWIFPLPHGRANVGLGMLSADVSRHRVNLRQRLTDILRTHPALAARFANAVPEGPASGFGLPLGSRRRRLSGERFMLTGDAASLIDPFSGEGIGNAMISGRLAAAQAQTCFATQDFSAAAIRAYDQALYRKIGSELRLSYRMQQLVNYPWLFDWVVRKANRNQALQTMFTMMFENLDIRQELSKPGFYLKLLNIK